MISINYKKVEPAENFNEYDFEKIDVKHFPDGTQMLLNIDIDYHSPTFQFLWKYETDEECMTLFYIVSHIREKCDKTIPHKFYLHMPYIPNARMDRTNSKSEVFTLKYFANFINSLSFDEVYVSDPHSYVSSSLFNNLSIFNAIYPIRTAINKLWKYSYPNFSGIVFYFPDEGAMKRYSNLLPFNSKIIYGKKKRDWKTGKILGIDIINENNIEISGSIILMIDDIISYGGTLAYSADELRKLGASNIFAYATHVENSIDNEEKGTLLQRLKNGTVTCVFTTNSIYNGNNEKIEIIT